MIMLFIGIVIGIIIGLLGSAAAVVIRELHESDDGTIWIEGPAEFAGDVDLDIPSEIERHKRAHLAAARRREGWTPPR